MGTTVAALQASMSHEEYMHWLAFDGMRAEEQADARNKASRQGKPVTSRDAALELKRRRGL